MWFRHANADQDVFEFRYAKLERGLGEVDRARAIYVHASAMADPRRDTGFWADWNAFEVHPSSCAVLCCAVLCCAVLCCAVLCCAVLCCAVLCCAVLCCAVLQQLMYGATQDCTYLTLDEATHQWSEQVETVLVVCNIKASFLCCFCTTMCVGGWACVRACIQVD